MKKAFQVLLVVILICAVIFAFLLYEYKKPRTIAVETSPDGRYSLSFLETESALFFGPSGVALVMKDKEAETYEIKTYIYNDGKYLDDNNWQVEWHSDYVEVMLKGEEQPDEVFVIRYIERHSKEAKERHEFFC